MVGRRRGPGRASTRAAVVKSPTPQPDPSDDEMQDAPSGEGTPIDQDDDDDDDAEGEADDIEDDGAASTGGESDIAPTRTRGRRSEGGSMAVAVATPTPQMPVKRRPGRPPKNRPADWDASDHPSDATPKRRGGFRGGRGFGGGRWKNRGGPSRVSQVPVDKEGNMATVRDDEVELPEDPEGEEKVDKLGHLKGGREYRVRTFTITGRGERLYMLSTEPARCIGFRDSYLFFQKHKQLFKIILQDDEKMDLIERDLMPHSYKGRSIGVVTARSVFREFGAKIIIGGKYVIDDYSVTASRADGNVEGELAVPDDILPAPGDAYDRNRYVAWHGASAVYHTGAPTVPLQPGKDPVKKRKVTVTGINWQFEHAREASRFNSTLAYVRRQNNAGVYDMHTNAMHYPSIMQPTHVRWEELPPPSSTTNATTTRNSTITTTDSPTLFPQPNSFQYRNLLTVDTIFRTPAVPHASIPGPDGAAFSSNGSASTINNAAGLGSSNLADAPDDVVAELPEECRAAFEAEKKRMQDWASGWGTETQECNRGTVRVTF